MITGIIMAGGSGTRFWPLSRKNYPKQFLALTGSLSLLDQTINRLDQFCDTLIIVGSLAHHEILKPYESKGIKVLYEPIGRNTAPCLAWACATVLKQDPNAQLFISPADHLIDNEPSFIKCAQTGLEHAAHHPHIITIGIETTSAHTGYGYIESAHSDTPFKPVHQFHEKPDLSTAKIYHKSSNHYWNSGMFIVSATYLMQLFQTHLPAYIPLLEKLSQSEKPTQTLFEQFERISIDFGIMEKCQSDIRMICSTFIWDDLGGWDALARYLPKDNDQNHSNHASITKNSSSNTLYSSSGKPIVLLNTHDLLVVDTEDAVFVCPKSSHQDIKSILSELPEHLL